MNNYFEKRASTRIFFVEPKTEYRAYLVKTKKQLNKFNYLFCCDGIVYPALYINSYDGFSVVRYNKIVASNYQKLGYEIIKVN